MMSRQPPRSGGHNNQTITTSHHVYQVAESHRSQRAARQIQMQYSDPTAKDKFDAFARRCHIIVAVLFSINILTSISMTIFVVSAVRIDRNGPDSSYAAVDLDDDISYEAGSSAAEIGRNSSWKACVACGTHAQKLERIGWKRQPQQQICCTDINTNFCSRVNEVGRPTGVTCTPYASPVVPQNKRNDTTPRVRVLSTGLYLVYSTATFPCVLTTTAAEHRIFVQKGRTLALDRQQVAATSSRSSGGICYTSRLLLTTSLAKDEVLEVVTTFRPNEFSVKTNLRLHRVG